MHESTLCVLSSFATLEKSGLLFYNGRFNEKHDFIALEIQQGQVVFKYSTGTSSGQVIDSAYAAYIPWRKQCGSLNIAHMSTVPFS